ncbi:MAG: hypothetical protein B6245_11110 [Desulfobacteraceae bacterium 4572_88]|nr:MAG: hypothetical protein B6245_11110 [Desulfobacteraceae bacterium 4572_88]
MEKHAPLATGEVYGENINRSELNKLSEEMEIKLTEKLPVVEGKILSAKGRRLTLDIGKENQIREDMKIIIS